MYIVFNMEMFFLVNWYTFVLEVNERKRVEFIVSSLNKRVFFYTILDKDKYDVYLK